MTRSESSSGATRDLLQSAFRLGFGRVGFCATRPGELERSNGEDIAVRGHTRYWPSTAIYRPTLWVEDDFNLWQLARYAIDRRWEVVADEALHPGATSEQYEEWGRSQMTSTVDVAKRVALAHLGHEVTQSGAGVVVVSLVPGPAMGVLREGDVIVAINDSEVRTTDDLPLALASVPDGASITLTIEPVNPGDRVRSTVKIRPSSGMPRLGAILRTYQRSYDYPIDVQVPVEGAGASGSLAIALGIVDVLTEVDVAAVPTAVTGVLHPDGGIGAVTGVLHKAVSLRGTEVRRFLVPEGQGAEANHAAVPGVEVIEVASFKDALDAIQDAP